MTSKPRNTAPWAVPGLPTLAITLCLCFGGLPMAWASESNLSIQYVADANLEIDDGRTANTVDGDGFTVDIRVAIARRVFFYGEVFNRRYKTLSTEQDWDQTRFGVALTLMSTPAAGFWVGAGSERIRQSRSGLADSANGFSLRAGVQLPLANGTILLGQAAYLDIETLSGAELGVGISVPLGHDVDLIANYRLTQLEDAGNGADLSLDDLSLGIRLEY